MRKQGLLGMIDYGLTLPEVREKISFLENLMSGGQSSLSLPYSEWTKREKTNLPHF
jgi:hypothetical protein